MDEEKQIHVIGGMPVSDMPFPPAPSKKGECFNCGQPTWVSYATIEDMENEYGSDYEIACIPCVILHGDVTVVQPGPKTIEAVADHLSKLEKNSKGLVN